MSSVNMGSLSPSILVKLADMSESCAAGRMSPPLNTLR
jgi:hypothetical protein